MLDAILEASPIDSPYALVKTPVIALRSLSLSHFRNYAALRLELEAKPVILTGPNGAGKTNILEAVSFLMPGRGLRRAKLSEIDRLNDGQVWAVAAEVQTPQGEVKIGTGRDALAGLEGVDKRLVKIDGKLVKNHAELTDYVSIAWLTPQMDQLFQEGNSARRKFLDRLVFGFDGEHASRVNAYEYAMRERNRLLSTGYGRADPQWLDSLERKLAETGVAITIARLQTVAHLNEVMRASTLSFPKAELALVGMAEDALVRGIPAVEIEQQLMDALFRARVEDAQTGRTGAGPHKSELTAIHSEKRMEAAFCSTGEQKALLLAIVLAEARAGALWHGRIPLLLLDEVVAHLDVGRRRELFEEILTLGAQAWMTGTDSEFFEEMRDKAQGFRVENGLVFSID